MAWSRIESGFWHHPKFAGWTHAQRWALGELFGYCCEYRTEGIVPQDLSLLPRGITTTFIDKAIASGWIDVSEDGVLHIHDWHIYHPKDPTASVRQSRKRHARNRDNAVTKPVTVTPPTNTNTNTNKPTNQPTSTADQGGLVGSENGETNINPNTVLKEIPT